MKKKLLTVKSLIIAERCPFCGASVNNYSNLTVDGELVSQDARCDSCGKEWQEVYQLAFVFVKPAPDEQSWKSIDVNIRSTIEDEESR